MSNTRRQAHHTWTKFREIKPLYLVIALLVTGSISALALRANNQEMASLRQAVYTADEQGGDVETALHELREFVYAHMNTSLSSGENAVYPPIQLKYTYERLQLAQQEQVKVANERIYTDAQAHCEALYPESYSGGPRVPCISEYVESHGVQLEEIPDSLYKFDFVSARFSWDLAGWSLFISALLLILLVARLLTPLALRIARVL